MKDGKRQEIGLGGYPSVKLAAARSCAEAMRAKMKAGVDVLAERRSAKIADKRKHERTFETVAKLVLGQRTGLSDKTNALWWARLQQHAFPLIGTKPIDEIESPCVIEVLEPIWSSKPETARRLRRAISSILKYASSRQWRGPVPSLSDVTKDAFPAHTAGLRHHPAVDFTKAAGVLAILRSQDHTMGRLALLFTIFTAVRSGETRLADWNEIDLDGALWTIPAARMKMNRDHVVPLSNSAVTVLKVAKAAAGTGLVFPGAKLGRPLSDMTMLKANRLAAPGTVPHGWRSTFRDWAAETTDHDTDVCEAALAHRFGTTTTRSYQRLTLLDKRRRLMADWALYLEGENLH